MKILHVVHGYPPSIGGAQLLVQNISEHLVNTYQDQVTVFTPNTYFTHQFRQPNGPLLPVGDETIAGVSVRRFPIFNRLSLLRIALSSLTYRLKLPGNDWFRTLENGPIMIGLRQAIKESQADVVLASAFPLWHMYDALAAAQQANIPLVFLGALHPTDTWGFDRPMIYRAMQQADAYIALTTFERDYVISKGLAPERVSVVGGGISPDFFAQANPQAIRQQYPLADGPIVVTLGGQVARKRLDTLLEAMTLVWKTHPHAQLIIAGRQGDYSPQLNAHLNSLPSSQRNQVIVISDFAEAEKADILAAADIFALCSGEESFGIVFVEAWASGKPVIGANVGAIKTLVQDHHNGLLFEYGDPESLKKAICFLIDHPAKRHTFGQAGRNLVYQHYTWPAITEKVRHIYQTVVAKA